MNFECGMPKNSSNEKESEKQGALHDESSNKDSSVKCQPDENLRVGWQYSMRGKPSHGMEMF